MGALARHTGQELHAEMTLVKRIPVGGGLGGGSSDAAAALNAANAVFDLGLEPEELASIGHQIGSDIPFFLDNTTPPRSALVTDFGRAMRRCAPVNVSMLLIIPNFGCATPEVYREYDQSALTLDESRVAQMALSGEASGESLFNDLALPAQRAEPRLRELIDRLKRLTREPIHVSGSGSTLFLMTDSPEALVGELEPHLLGARCLAANSAPRPDGSV